MELPEGGLLGKVWSYWVQIRSMHIGQHAANAGYFIALSVFPTLVLLMGLLRYTGLGAESLTEMLHGILPTALMPAAQKLIMNTYQGTNSAVLSISAVTALWSASRGIHGLRTGLNAIYGVSENRGYFHTRMLSVFYTFAFLIVLVLTLVLHVFGTELLGLLPLAESPVFRFLESVVDLRFFLLLGPLVMAGMGAWYYYAPAKEPNYGLGYRTKWSMASPAAWRYAQRGSGMIYMILGGALAVIVLVLSLFFGLMSPVTVAVISLIAVFLEALLALGAFILVENLLRKHFDANGDRI